METNCSCKLFLVLLAAAALVSAAPNAQLPRQTLADAQPPAALREARPADTPAATDPSRPERAPKTLINKTTADNRVSTSAENKESSSDDAAETNYLVDARVFISGEAARGEGGEVGKDQLSEKEKELTLFLAYRDYLLMKKKQQTVVKDQAVSVVFAENKSVRITPLSESAERIKLMIEWKIPGEEDNRWRKLLYFRKKYRSLVGGPKIDGGGMYLLSLEVQ